MGESATYYVKVYLPESIDTSQIVTVHDVLAKSDDGTIKYLKFNNDVKVYTSNTDPGSTVDKYKALEYNYLTTSFDVRTQDLTDNCDFEIDIKPDVNPQSITDDLAGHYIVFKYSAELTSAAEGAVINSSGEASPEYPNTEHSTYYSHETVLHTVNVVTYKFEFSKIDDKTEEALDGAKFELRTSDSSDAQTISFVRVADGNYKKADRDDEGTVTEIVVNSKTGVTPTVLSGFGGADNTNGTNYYLYETVAPSGYNKLTVPIIVNVKDDGTITATLNGKTISETGAFSVANNTGTVLPSTGGIGTTIFYIIGGALVVGAIVTLVTRRNMSK